MMNQGRFKKSPGFGRTPISIVTVSVFPSRNNSTDFYHPVA